MSWDYVSRGEANQIMGRHSPFPDIRTPGQPFVGNHAWEDIKRLANNAIMCDYEHGHQIHRRQPDMSDEPTLRCGSCSQHERIARLEKQFKQEREDYATDRAALQQMIDDRHQRIGELEYGRMLSDRQESAYVNEIRSLQRKLRELETAVTRPMPAQKIPVHQEGIGSIQMNAQQHRALAEEWIEYAKNRIEEYTPHGSVDMTAAIASLALAHAVLATLPEEPTRD